MPSPAVGSHVWLDRPGLQALIEALTASGHRVIGPRVADDAIVLRDLDAATQLPHGWLDEQDGGSYRLSYDPAAGTFDHVVGPHSLKQFLFPPRETIQRFERINAAGQEGPEQDGAWQERDVAHDDRPLAVIGVRGCDLAALAVQDAVFIRDDWCDPAYAARRATLFIVAVNCRRAAATCFCHSMGTGPAAATGFDLALTEVADRFVVEAGTPAGAACLTLVAEQHPLTHCSAAEIDAVRAVPRDLRGQMAARSPAQDRPRPRSLDTTGIRDLLFDNLEHPRWRDVADRCLSCANCTLVCPTCFCHSVEDVADLSGDHVARDRRWASCFTLDHGRMHGGNARPTTASRYRQWLTHKLAGWIDQFGTSGCTGCGRCITWCPVGIDITAEVAAIRGTSDPERAA
jgi:sulfhydrogenase subunit beta (sulfur reductase)